MNAKTLLRLLALLAAFGLLAAACSDSSSDSDETDASADESSDDSMEDDEDSMEDDEDSMEDDEDSMEDEEHAGAPDLSEVCPATLSLQTDWFPEAEHGAVYNMIGDDYTIDGDNMIVSGPLVSEGEDTGIVWEVRTGGPAIGFSPVAAHVYASDDIQLGYANTEAQALQFADTPMISVVAPLEKNPQMIMWDPETLPDVNGIADLGKAGTTINVFGGGVFSEVFVAQGIWSEDQVDPSYDGSPAAFVSADGSIAQQGFASAEPYVYKNEVESWGKDVEFELLHDAGFEVYAATIGVRADLMEELDECLTELVPIIQKSTVSYYADPDRANAIIIDAVETFDSFWVYNADLAAFSVETQNELDLASNGDNDTVGDIDADRIQRVIDSMTGANMDVADITAEDIFTNKYIDESIGF